MTIAVLWEAGCETPRGCEADFTAVGCRNETEFVRLLRDAGWTVGNRGPWRRTLCPDHRRGPKIGDYE